MACRHRTRCNRTSETMNLSDLISRPDFIPPFADWASIRNMRIAITGSSGILGTLLLESLSNAGLVASCFEDDITNGPKFRDWISTYRPQALIHLAAIVPLAAVEADPIRAMEVNATSLLTLISSVKDHAPDCWVFYASTSHAYQSNAAPLSETSTTIPASLYGATKLAGESILRPLAERFSVKLCVARIFSYIHEQQDTSFLIPGIGRQVQSSPQGGSIELRNPRSKRDFLHASMVVDAMLHLLRLRYAGIVNIGSGRATSVLEIAERVIALSGKDLSIRTINIETPTTIVADVARLRSLGFPRAS